MREVTRSYSDSIPPVILNKKPVQNQFWWPTQNQNFESGLRTE
jgi:hypothetical protein